MTFERTLQELILSGNVEDLASRLGKSTSLLYRWGNPNDETQMPVLALPALMEATGDFRLIKWLCRRFGFVAVKLPRRVSKVGPRDVAAVQKALNEVVSALIEASEGGMSANEAGERVYRGIETLVYVQRQIADEQLPILREPQMRLAIGDQK